jgi:hypothetical protein
VKGWRVVYLNDKGEPSFPPRDDEAIELGPWAVKNAADIVRRVIKNYPDSRVKRARLTVIR